MTRFTKTALLTSLVLGIFAVATPEDAEAGWGYGRNAYVSSCYTTYRPSYDYYCAPRVYRSTYYPSYAHCGFGGYYNDCYSNYRTYCGYGFRGYNSCYPINYIGGYGGGYCGW
ncbi:MAG: hypothetical protein GY768_00975 [Planctomycetaceae bacterium]|nr:hypothetical protein [Planctomycetaceae bacterium]